MGKSRSSGSFFKKMAWPGMLAVILITFGLFSLTLRGVDIFALVAAATTSLVQAPVTLYLTSYDDQVLEVGGIKKIDIGVNARVPINAVGATIKFPQNSMEVVGFSKEKSFFDLWTEETAINEDAGEIHFSGGTTQAGGVTGTGTVLTLTVRAKKAGQSALFFYDSQIYSNDGKGTLLDNDVRSLTLDVRQSAPVNVSPSRTTVNISAQPEKPLPKSADLNGDGLINIIDMSIMIIHLMMAPYDQRYDFNVDGVVNISDLSILLSQVR